MKKVCADANAVVNQGTGTENLFIGWNAKQKGAKKEPDTTKMLTVGLTLHQKTEHSKNGMKRKNTALLRHSIAL